LFVRRTIAASCAPDAINRSRNSRTKSRRQCVASSSGVAARLATRARGRAVARRARGVARREVGAARARAIARATVGARRCAGRRAVGTDDASSLFTHTYMYTLES
jgi:hypothetical protein